MELIRSFGKDDLAQVYVLKLREGPGHLVECVESLQPPRPRSEKWVLIVSTLFGCPVGCSMCDAGGWYRGPLTAEEILAQVGFLVERRFGGATVPVKKFKIQFARMGEPALNAAVPEVLERLSQNLDAPGLLPSVSSVAPAGKESFFEQLLAIKDRHYGSGRFQLQFSIHSTDPVVRREIVPIRTMDFEWMGTFGKRFRRSDDQRITLNFAAAEGVPFDPRALLPHFDPEHFLLKITPLNPTWKVQHGGLRTVIDPGRPETGKEIVERCKEAGYEVILSIGEQEENAIGSNCGQYATCLEGEVPRIREGYLSRNYEAVKDSSSAPVEPS